jgi:hypothetical protein
LLADHPAIIRRLAGKFLRNRATWIANAGLGSLRVVEGEAVLAAAAEAYRVALGDRLKAAYALGSLAHGGFSPLVSDIDLGLILSDPVRDGDGDGIQRIADAEKRKGSELHQRLSVFWGTPSTLRGEQEGGRFPPLDRLDLLDNGRLLAGSDARAGLPRPHASELLVAGAEFAVEYLAGIRPPAVGPAQSLGSLTPAGEDAIEEIRSADLLIARGVRRITKLVLFPVRFLFTAATGQVGTNDDAVARYLRDRRAPGAELVAAARGWRKVPPSGDGAVELLRDQMVPLYLQYIDDHIARLGSLGEAELAGAFREWRERLLADDVTDRQV